MQVCVRDDLVQVGWTEDGDADIARCFYLVARADNGAQVAHDYPLVAHRGGADAAIAKMDALRARVARHLAAGGALDPTHWNEIDPAYGSDEYQRLDAFGFFRAKEVLAMVDAGEPISRETEDEARGVLAYA